MTFSFSNLNSFHSCKYCWFKGYAERDSEKVSNAFADYGLMMHEIFELLDTKLIGKDIAQSMANGRLSNIDLGMAFGHDLNTLYAKATTVAIENYNTVEKIVSLEENVNFEIDGYKFTGFIDQLLLDEDGEYIVVDHKSKSNFKSKKEQAQYARQLYLYSIAIFNKYGKYPKELRFNMFRKQNVVVIPFKEKDLQEAKEWAIETIQEIIETEIFPPTTDEFLRDNLCNYRHQEEHQDGECIRLDDYKPRTVWRRCSIVEEGNDTNE